MKRTLVATMAFTGILAAHAAVASADDLYGTCVKIIVQSPSVGNVRAGLVQRANLTYHWVDFIGGITETATHPTLNRRELMSRLAVASAARSDSWNNQLNLWNLVKVSSTYYQANRTSMMEARFTKDSRWVGVTPGWRTSFSFSSQTVTADRILGMGITKEPNKLFDVEYGIVRIGNESWNLVCIGDPAGAQLDTGIFASTPIQRDHFMMLAAQQSGRLYVGNCRQYGYTGFYLHNMSRFEQMD